MICTLHPLLEQQILDLSKMMHETKMAVIKALVAGISMITAVVSAGVLI